MLGVDSNFRVGDTHQLGLRAMGSRHRDESRLETDGYVLDGGIRKRGRNLSYSLDASVLSPDFRTDVGYVRRTDQRLVEGRVGYEWWPQHWIISWGPEIRYGRNYNFGDALQDENTRFEIEADFAKNVRYQFRVHRDMERYEGIDFDKRRFSMFGNVNTSRRISVGGGFNWGDAVYFDPANPFLGRESGLRLFTSLRPVSRFQTRIDINTSRFTDPYQPVVKVADPAWPGSVVCRTLSDMAMGKRAARQASPMWVDTADLPTSDGHPFFERLNRVLEDCGFDAFVEELCATFYADRLGRPSLRPGRYFRMLFIGYFEGVSSERGIAWRVADSLSLRSFLDLDVTAAAPDHSTLSRTRRRIDVETHEAVFTWILERLSAAGLVRGKTVAIDATTLEANAAMRSIERRDTGESHEAFIRRLAEASGVETPTRADLARFDRSRKNKKTSNKEWKSGSSVTADPLGWGPSLRRLRRRLRSLVRRLHR